MSDNEEGPSKEGLMGIYGKWMAKQTKVPEWLNQFFDSKEHKDRMNVLRKINVDSMNCRVENN